MSTEWLTDYDIHLWAEGNHARTYEKLGAHVTERDGVAGTQFAVWAPNARSVSRHRRLQRLAPRPDLDAPRQIVRHLAVLRSRRRRRRLLQVRHHLAVQRLPGR